MYCELYADRTVIREIEHDPYFINCSNDNVIKEFYDSGDKKILWITDIDLDGVGCAIVARYCTSTYSKNANMYLPRENIDIIHPERIERDQVFIDAVLSNKYDMIVTSDWTPTKESFNKVKDSDIKVFCIDHHISGINCFKETIKQDDCNFHLIYSIKECATSLTWLIFKSINKANWQELARFVSEVRAYDIWVLNSIHRIRGEDQNILFYHFGWDVFYKGNCISLSNLYVGPDTNKHKFIIEPIRNRAIEKKKNFQNKPWYTSGLVEAPYQSNKDTKNYWLFVPENLSSDEMGFLLESRPEIDLVVTYDATGKLSFRSNGNVDCSELAVILGGGGHKRAAGAKMGVEFDKEILQEVYSEVLEVYLK